MWWLALFGVAVAVAQLVMMMVHLRHLERLAAAQVTMVAQWDEIVRALHQNLDVSVSARGRVAVCNEATSTVEEWLNYGLGRRSGWRICATSGMAAGCALISTTGWGATACFVWGVTSAALAAAVGRRADSLASQIRGRWNGLIRSLARSFPDDTASAETV